ncbi:glutamyl-tRNA reductase-binding protein, chloroplastic-like isoform X2 [Aristolochia californica]|uniref:glutamyl-tRNA reductase-binding protein, chloroplastic-like isoform X2 n=1 Tax=Aristolochia californica TaxID=171875 RepID=UPI0035D607C3
MISISNPTYSLSIPSVSFSTSSLFTQREVANFSHSRRNPCLRSSPNCCVSLAQPTMTKLQTKPSPAEVSRTIMELSSKGTLCTLNQEGWPLGIGVPFAVDPQGLPILCLNAKNRDLSTDTRSSFHVQLEQSGIRRPQCILVGSLNKPEDSLLLKFHEQWVKRFGEKVDEDLIYVVYLERLLHLEESKEDGIWVTSLEYMKAYPDPLRNYAEKIVNEMNANHMEDVHRFCSIYVDLGFEVAEAKMIWVDRLGFDVRLHSTQNNVYEVRIPFDREVADEKGVKSSLNCMSQLAWEVEKNYIALDFEKVTHLKQICFAGN